MRFALLFEKPQTFRSNIPMSKNKNSSMPFLRSCFLSCLLIFLAACGSQQIKVAEKTEGVRVPLMPTQQYIPNQKFDKEGYAVPYKARENPYLAKKSRVKKESVEQFIQVKRYLKTGDNQRAKNLLEKIVEEDKRVSGPHVLLGDLEQKSGNLAKAIEYYETAIAINKRNLNAYTRLGEARRKNGDYGIAQNIYAQALKIWPDFPEAHLSLGVLYDVYLNDATQAQRHIESFLFLTGGEDQEAHLYLAEIMSRTELEPALEVNTPVLFVSES